ncbi:LCP family protein [Demequina aurantiaca]|uniref:LCP family protein n=1 Tax=Demequina aurantiaca TaxID=676200 RepID=UPI000780382B|nr:LCP family protein [Demequina aurantiaca]
MAKRDKGARHGTTAPRHRVLTGVLWGVAAIAGFAVAYAGTNFYLLQNSLTTKDVASLYNPNPEATGDPDAEGPPLDGSAGNDVNILLMGSDTREGTENEAIGGEVAGMRSDTVIVMHISADRERIDFMSIPRDSRVAVSDCTMFDGTVTRGWTGKFNIAFANGGKNGDPAEAAACTMQTVTDLTGIKLDHYAVVDFAGFEQMINAIDGVPMCIPNNINSTKAKLHLEAGPQVLDGETALAYARARTGEGLPEGTDLRRIDRQQELLMNVLRKALGANMLTDVGGMTQFVKAGAQAMTMDPDLGSIKYILGLAYSLRGIDTANITFATVPWAYPGDNNGDVIWTPDADIMFAHIVADEPITDPDEVDATSPSPEATADSKSTTDTTTATDADAGTTTATKPDASVTDTAAEPSVAPSPERETQAEILAACG